MREKILSEYISEKSSKARLVEMIVGRCLIKRSLMHKNNEEVTKLLVSSVPKSSIIKRSQSKMVSFCFMSSILCEKVPLANWSNKSNAEK